MNFDPTQSAKSNWTDRFQHFFLHSFWIAIAQSYTASSKKENCTNHSQLSVMADQTTWCSLWMNWVYSSCQQIVPSVCGKSQMSASCLVPYSFSGSMMIRFFVIVYGCFWNWNAFVLCPYFRLVTYCFFGLVILWI